MKHIKEVIKQTARQPQELKCKHCENLAKAILTDNRWKIYCPWCQQEYYLKEQHI